MDTKYTLSFVATNRKEYKGSELLLSDSSPIQVPAVGTVVHLKQYTYDRYTGHQRYISGTVKEIHMYYKPFEVLTVVDVELEKP